MTWNPFGPLDSRWLLLRLFLLGFAIAVHPLPFDLRGWGLVVPARSAQTAYVAFECLQTVVFAAAIFFGDEIPGMRLMAAYYRRLVAELQQASLTTRLVKPLPFVIGSGLAAWFVLAPFDVIVNAVPLGAPRLAVETAHFIIGRCVIVWLYVIIVTADDDDEPGVRRRSIATTLAKLLRLSRVRVVTRIPATTS